MNSCWLLDPLNKSEKSLKITVVYIAVTNGSMIDTYAPRFVKTYLDHPAEYPHRLLVVCNGGKLAPHRAAYFAGVDCDFLERENDPGYDISAYQEVAGRFLIESSADFLVCFGESVFFHRAGWLKRWADARSEYGPGIFGAFSSHFVRAHLNTTCFGTDPRLLAKYPQVRTNPERYAFEHGQNCYWKRLVAGKNQAALVTFDGVYFQGEWRRPNNIMHRGNQSNLLVQANHSEKWATADPVTKQLWQTQSDSPFRL